MVCGDNNLLVPARKVTLSFGGRTRHWYIYVPSSTSAGSSIVPLVVDLHGYGSCAEKLSKYSGWSRLAAEHGFVVAWPQGTEELSSSDPNPSWNAGQCCGEAIAGGGYVKAINDVGFLRAVVNETAATEPVDRLRVYFTGHSNGCSAQLRPTKGPPSQTDWLPCVRRYSEMAQRMAADASDMLAAIA